VIQKLRNIAIIAHVDHGKTTLVDKLLQQSGTVTSRGDMEERVMDSNDIEKERGITILAKNTAIEWNGYHINIVDTPGHADFGGEVERVMSMVDSVLLLVDAAEGPMPQTRFVTQKALAQGLNPIVVVNKIDRNGARPDWAVDQTFDLFDRLGATDEQMDFPIIYCSAINGYAGLESDVSDGDMTSLFETIVEHVKAPDVDVDGPFQMQVSALDYNSYTGVIGIGRVTRGKVKANSPVIVVDTEGKERRGRMLQIFGFLGLDRIEKAEVQAGDIIAFTGLDPLNISDTICDPNNVEAMTPLSVDEPTVSMTFGVNNSPFAGQDGKYLTSRQIRERLQRELLHNVALRVEETEDPDRFKVSGRGELHLSILIENMRREGYELGVSRPEVIIHTLEDGSKEEPYEQVTVDVEMDHQGGVMEKLGERGGDSVFDHYGPVKVGDYGQRQNGVMISNGKGKALGFSLWNLQERGKLFIGANTEVYEGSVIGIHARDNDLVVNPLKGKQLTNVRASGTDENIQLTPCINLSLEQALEFIDDDELVEVTPTDIRLRKKILSESDRKKASRAAK
jgi:GTP-binding protein